MKYLLFIIGFASLYLTAQAAHHLGVHCDEVEKNCTANAACNASKNAWYTDCSDQIQDIAMCTPKCNATWYTLKRNPIGQLYEKCVCDADDYTCLARVDNFKYNCLNYLQPTPAPCKLPSLPSRPSDIPVCDYSSNSACGKDSTCNPLFQRYVATCAAVFANQGQCSRPCKASLNAFTCNSIAQKSLYCKCALTEASHCLKGETYVLQRCFQLGQFPSLPVSQDCSTVGIACYSDKTCNASLNAYTAACKGLLSGSTTQCSAACNASFLNLVKDPIGYHFSSCSCGSDGNCVREGSLFSYHCLNHVSNLPSFCSQILDGCYWDKACNATRQVYLDTCKSDFGKSCSPGCKAAAKAILSNPIGGRLNYCYCDDKDQECKSYIDITTKCLATPPPPTTKAPAKSTTAKQTTMKPTSAAAYVYLSIFAAFFGLLAHLML